MKFDIENKILITFISIVLLIIVFLGSASYFNGYKLLTNTYEKKAEEKLNMLDNHLESIAKFNGSYKDNPFEIDGFLKSMGENILIIRDGKFININGFDEKEKVFELSDEEKISILDLGTGKIENDNGTYIFREYPDMNLTVIYAIKKDFFYEDLVSLQKNILLIAIISLVFSMQAIIFTAHHLSRPLKKLANSCIRISKGAFDENITIKRKDEIGVLSKSFNEMIQNIRIYTREIERVKEFNEDILKNIPLGIMTFDSKGKMTSANETANILTEDDEVKILNKKIKDQISKTISAGEEINIIHEIIKKNGSKLFFDITTNLMKREEDKGVICIFSDITERKRIEERIERLNRLTSMGEIAAGLAHEIRNPLTGMKASIYVIKKRLVKEKNLEHDELLNLVLQEIERLNILVTELLDFTKQKKAFVEEVSIYEIMEKIKHLIFDEISKKDIRIDFKSNIISEKIMFDKGQLEQILLNLIYNSIDAVEYGGKIDITADLKRSDLESYFIVSVEDDGCGITDEDVDEIFNPFFTRKPKGTGLGLSVVQKLVEENGGDIKVKSIIGKGTRFDMRLVLSQEG